MKIENQYTDNDIYFIETVQDKIIINDNYEGVIILDSCFNVVKKLKLFDDMVIDTSFRKNNEIVLYCYENQCFIYLDINTYVYKIISLNSDCSEMNYLSLYEWQDDELSLLAENGEIILKIDLLTYTVQKHCNESEMFSVYQDYQKLNKLLLHKVYSEKNVAIVEKDSKLEIINYKEQSLLMQKKIDINFYDVEAVNEFIVQLDEYKIVISNSVKNVDLFPTNGYRFLRCKFIQFNKTIFLIVLSCCDADSSLCKLERYALGIDLLT